MGLLYLAAAVAMAAGPAAALVEVDLADIEGTEIRATLDEDDEGFVNPANGSASTQWIEGGITIEPSPGDFAYHASGNGGIGLRFATATGYGDGTAVVRLDAPQDFAAIEVGFQQPFLRVVLYADADGTQQIASAILAEREFPTPGLPVFAFHSDEPFQRVTIQQTDALGAVQNSNMISDLRFAAVPEPSRLVALAFAAATLTWLRRR